MPQSESRTYVLIHGAWFGGWVWKDVAARLRAAGHDVYAPSLTGLGERRHLIRPGITLGTHAEDVISLIHMEDLADVVLVGWSYGGMVVNDVLGLAPERIGAVVYLDAMMPDPGRTHSSYAAAHPTEWITELVATGQDIPPLPARAIGITDEALASHVEARLGPHPALTFLAPSRAPSQLPDVPYTYVLSGGHLDLSNTFQQFYDTFQERSLGQSHVIDTGHTMMLSEPKLTADLLLAAV
jgi:pimeloyl-ACP methyl ester carboxylesterase